MAACPSPHVRGRAARPVLEDEDGYERDAAKLHVGRRAGPGRRLPRALGGLERRAGHCASDRNDELFLAVGEAIRRGERPDYDNLESVTEETLQRRVAEAGGMAALVDRLQATSARLIEHAESL